MKGVEEVCLHNNGNHAGKLEHQWKEKKKRVKKKGFSNCNKRPNGNLESHLKMLAFLRGYHQDILRREIL